MLTEEQAASAQGGADDQSTETVDNRQTQDGSSGRSDQPIVPARTTPVTQAQRLESAEGEPDWNNLDYNAAKKLRQEYRSLRRRLKDGDDQDANRSQELESTVSTLQTDLQSHQTTIAALEAENRTLRSEMVLSRLGARDPELLASKLTEEDLKDDKSAKAAVEALRKLYPHQFETKTRVQGSADGATDGTSATKTVSSMSQQIRAASGRVTPGS